MKEPQVEKNDYPTVPAAIIVGEGREFRDDYTFVIVKSGDNLDTGVFTNDPQAVVALYQNGLAGIEKHIPPVGTKRVLIADDAKGLGGLRIDTQADYEHKVHITILELNADGTIIIHHSDPAELKFVGKPVIVGVEIPDKLDTTGNSNHEFDEVIHELNWDSRASYSLISALREELYQLGFRFDQSTDRTFERLYAQFSLPFEFKRRIDQRREYAS